jgi:hypothetical protein
MTGEPDAPRLLVVTVFVEPGRYPLHGFTDGSARRDVARTLALTFLRRIRAVRSARRARRLRLRRIDLGRSPFRPFDHAVGRLELGGARARVVRMLAEFHDGVEPVGEATVWLRSGVQQEVTHVTA